MEKNSTKNNKIVIPLSNGYQLVAERNTDPNFDREIFIGIKDKNGVWWQDLAVVRPALTPIDYYATYPFTFERPMWENDKFEVLVYGKEYLEDFTDRFKVGLYREEEE